MGLRGLALTLFRSLGPTWEVRAGLEQRQFVTHADLEIPKLTEVYCNPSFITRDAEPLIFLSFFLIWGDTRSLRMPALRPASQAGPMRNPREGTSVVLRDTTRLT